MVLQHQVGAKLTTQTGYNMNRNAISNHDLIMLYKSSMVRDYFTIRGLQGHYHPKYEHNAVNVPASVYLKTSFFYSRHSMTLLKEMWKRCNEGTFYEEAFWTSRKVFQTNISRAKEEVVTKSDRKSVV